MTDKQDDPRVAVLEQNVAELAKGMSAKLDDISEALRTLVRIEERQVQQNQRLELGAKTFADHEARLRVVENAMPKELDRRLGSIETKMPGLVETKTWVGLGIIGGLGMMGAAVFHIVFKT